MSPDIILGNTVVKNLQQVLSSSNSTTVFTLKPGQNKKGQNFFQLHRFLNTFLQLAAEKKYSKNGAAGNFFGPSYFVTALDETQKPGNHTFSTQAFCKQSNRINSQFLSENLFLQMIQSIMNTFFFPFLFILHFFPLQLLYPPTTSAGAL